MIDKTCKRSPPSPDGLVQPNTVFIHTEVYSRDMTPCSDMLSSLLRLKSVSVGVTCGKRNFWSKEC